MKRYALLAALAIAASAFAAPAVPNPPVGLFVIGNALNPTPDPNSISAATLTAQNNALCQAIEPYYWEIGNATGPIASASVTPVTVPATTPIISTTPFSIASGSKMVYAAYIMALRNGVANYTSDDITALNFTDGYANCGNSTGGGSAATCDRSVYSTINLCLTQTGPTGPFNQQLSSAIGKFAYDACHMENHASRFTALGNVNFASLFAVMNTTMNLTGDNFLYSQPLPAGGVYGSSNDYAIVLRALLSGLINNDALGTHSVCTNAGGNYSAQTVGGVFPGPTSCVAQAGSPIPENWQYSMGFWIETAPGSHGDGAFSSPGAFGFVPWIDSTKTWYGTVARSTQPTGGSGYISEKCGRLIRHAWITGVEQTHIYPDQP